MNSVRGKVTKCMLCTFWWEIVHFCEHGIRCFVLSADKLALFLYYGGNKPCLSIAVYLFSLYTDLMIRSAWRLNCLFWETLQMQIRKSRKPFCLGAVALFPIFFVCALVVELQRRAQMWCEPSRRAAARLGRAGQGCRAAAGAERALPAPLQLVGLCCCHSVCTRRGVSQLQRKGSLRSLSHLLNQGNRALVLGCFQFHNVLLVVAVG